MISEWVEVEKSKVLYSDEIFCHFQQRKWWSALRAITHTTRFCSYNFNYFGLTTREFQPPTATHTSVWNVPFLVFTHRMAKANNEVVSNSKDKNFLRNLFLVLVLIPLLLVLLYLSSFPLNSFRDDEVEIIRDKINLFL